MYITAVPKTVNVTAVPKTMYIVPKTVYITAVQKTKKQYTSLHYQKRCTDLCAVDHSVRQSRLAVQQPGLQWSGQRREQSDVPFAGWDGARLRQRRFVQHAFPRSNQGGRHVSFERRVTDNVSLHALYRPHDLDPVLGTFPVLIVMIVWCMRLE